MNDTLANRLIALALAGLLAPAALAAEIETDGGISISDRDQGYSFDLGGRVMWDFAAFDNDPNGGQNVSGTEFRRIRLTAKGSALGWGYVIQPDFAGDALTMKDVYISRKLGTVGTLKMGQFKQPFGLEELTSSKYITVQERSIASELAASHQMGVGLFGSRNNISWGASAYSLDSNDGDVNNGTGVGARLSFAPLAEADRVVHLGLALARESYGKSADAGDNDRYRVRYRVAGHLSDASRPTLIDLNHGQRSEVTKLGVEAAAVFGPFSVQGEYVNVDAEDDTERGEVGSYYLQLSAFVTGESRRYKAGSGTFGKIRPGRDSGAFELVLRRDYGTGEQGPIGGALGRDTELEIWTAGVNWYANANMRVMLDYWTAEVTDRLTQTRVDAPSAITGRVQLHF